MASPSAGSDREAGAPPPVAAGAPPPVAAGAPVDTSQLDLLCEKALVADKACRDALSAAYYGRAADEALRLQGETFVCTFLRLQHSCRLIEQSQLRGVTPREKAALETEAWALLYSCLPLIVRRMDDNTMLPGRGLEVELSFFK